MVVGHFMYKRDAMRLAHRMRRLHGGYWWVRKSRTDYSLHEATRVALVLAAGDDVVAL